MRLIPHTPAGTAATSRHAALGTAEAAGRPLARFGLHYLEMCVVMCVGGITLSLLFFEGAVLLGFSDLPGTAPVLSVAVIAANLTAPMLVWMRYRGMAWRPTLEMAATTVLTGAALIVGYLTGIVEKSALIDIQTSLACPLMLAVMLPRFRLYSSPHHRARPASVAS